VLDLSIASKRAGFDTRSLVGGLVSIGAHAVLIVALVHHSATGSERPAMRYVDSIIIAPTVVPGREPDRSRAQPEIPTLDLVVESPTVLPLPTITGALLATEWSTRFDPLAYPGHGAVEGMAGILADGASVDPTATFSYSVVEDPPALLSCPAPVYPRGLRDAGIEGEVLAEVVIDRDGRVDPSSIAIVESSHRGFDRAVVEMYRDRRRVFQPGRVAGEPVRVLVRQQTAFRIR